MGPLGDDGSGTVGALSDSGCLLMSSKCAVSVLLIIAGLFHHCNIQIRLIPTKVPGDTPYLVSHASSGGSGSGALPRLGVRGPPHTAEAPFCFSIHRISILGRS